MTHIQIRKVCPQVNVTPAQITDQSTVNETLMHESEIFYTSIIRGTTDQLVCYFYNLKYFLKAHFQTWKKNFDTLLYDLNKSRFTQHAYLGPCKSRSIWCEQA